MFGYLSVARLPSILHSFLHFLGPVLAFGLGRGVASFGVVYTTDTKPRITTFVTNNTTTLESMFRQIIIHGRQLLQ